MRDEDYEAIEALVAEYFLANGPVPDHQKSGARCEWFIDLLAILKEHGYGASFVFYSTSSKSTWQLIMGKAFHGEIRNKKQRDLRENIIADLRAAISIFQKAERLAKAKREAPEKESIPDIQVQEPVVELEPETEPEVSTSSQEPSNPKEKEEVDYSKTAKEFKSAAEANAGLAKLKGNAPPVEHNFDPVLSAALGLIKEEK